MVVLPLRRAVTVAASALERSRQAVLDILGHIVIENLPTQHGPNPHRSTAEGLSQASN